MFNIPAMISSIFKFGNKAIDAENNEKNFDLKDRKKVGVAMEAGEREFLMVESFLRNVIDKKQLEQLHRKYHKIYFANN